MKKFNCGNDDRKLFITGFSLEAGFAEIFTFLLRTNVTSFTPTHSWQKLLISFSPELILVREGAKIMYFFIEFQLCSQCVSL